MMKRVLASSRAEDAWGERPRAQGRAGLFAWIALGLLSGCPSGVDVEGRVFPCRSLDDCVEDYVCHPTRWVCVPVSECQFDGGPSPETCP